MNKKYLLFVVFLALTFSGWSNYDHWHETTPAATDVAMVKPCRYYAYILYGSAALVNNIRVKEKVYREVSVFKSEEGFYVCCNDYCSDSCAGFSVKNIGPYDTEVVCYAELQRQLNLLTAGNYKPYKKGVHMLIGVLEHNYKPCN